MIVRDNKQVNIKRYDFQETITSINESEYFLKILHICFEVTKININPLLPPFLLCSKNYNDASSTYLAKAYL